MRSGSAVISLFNANFYEFPLASIADDFGLFISFLPISNHINQTKYCQYEDFYDTDDNIDNNNMNRSKNSINRQCIYADHNITALWQSCLPLRSCSVYIHVSRLEVLVIEAFHRILVNKWNREDVYV